MARKYVTIILDGCADYPIAELGGKTPLEAAVTPNLDRMAAAGRTGLCQTTPTGMYTGSDNCCMGILGYDARKYYTGRGPIEAAALGIKLSEGDVCFRCNTVNIQNGVMKDFTAGHITSEESRQILLALDQDMGNEDTRFYPGVSYRHIMVINNMGAKAKCTPPHDIIDQPIAKFLPRDHDDAEFLNKIMQQAKPILSGHAVNEFRVETGELPATDIWLWGQGTAVSLPTFQALHGLKGAMITAVDLLRGLAQLSGLSNIDVPGATGWIDTDYAGKGRAAIEALKQNDFVCVHIEAPDESGHQGNPKFKTQSLTDIDKHIVGPILDYLQKNESYYRVMALPDHYTPCSLKTHSSEPVPFVMFGTGIAPSGSKVFSEKGVNQGDVVKVACELFPQLIQS